MDKKDKPKSIRCPSGYRKDPKTGECVKQTEERFKHRQSIRNKHKGVKLDEEGKRIKPPKWNSTKKSRKSDEDDRKRSLSDIKEESEEEESTALKPTQEEEQEEEESKKDKRKKCPKGYKKNKKTGECEKKQTNISEKIIEYSSESEEEPQEESEEVKKEELTKNKRKKCPNGYKKNKKTGECEKKQTIISENMKEDIDSEALVEAFIEDPEEVVKISKSLSDIEEKAEKESERIQLVSLPPIDYEIDEKTDEIHPFSLKNSDNLEENVGDFASSSEPSSRPSSEPSSRPSSGSSSEPSSGSSSGPSSSEPSSSEPSSPGPFSSEPSVSESSNTSRTVDEDVIKDELYPTLDDPNFSYKISKRKEFSDTKYDGSIKNIKEQANRLCNAPFELLPHQLFVRNFLSFQTPYNSLLLYHGLGSGKTCSAIGIAEEMRAYMKQMGITKRIIIVASPNVQDNFRLQLFDERKLEQLPDGTWNLNTCIGNSLLKEINPTNLQGLTRDRIISQIRSLINNYYVFMGNKGEFANYIRKAISIPTDSGYTVEEAALMREKKIKAHFNNRLVILDEIHNSRISDANKTKLTSILLNEIARKSDNMRLLLLSATPMYNSYNEIIWLVNLLNANDKRPAIKVDQVFQSNGDWVKGSNGEEIGKDVLIRKLTGYVSYVRGENPYVFPYRIYPEIFDPARVFIEDSNYPTRQMNQAPITEPLQFIPVYKNKIGSYQSQGYQAIIDYLGLKSSVSIDKNGKERIMPTFDNMESFGYTLLMAPLESLIITYPNPTLDKLIQSSKSSSEAAKKEMIKSMIGKGGLMANLKFSRTEKPIPKRYDYEYKPKTKATYGDIFSPENIGKYSAKIGNICDIIRRPSSGIILIYSQFIDGGLVPMALALESMGFSRYASTPDHNRNLFKHSVDPVDAITMEKVKKGSKGVAKYVMITGEKDFSQNNNEDLKYVTNKSNANGSQVKVILISMAASEGLDFKNIRQIHILEPWYNMNRIEQIIGRGVRNLSHCDLDFEDRNVEIYLHGTSLDRDEEAADMYVYRSAEKKAVQIGRVTRVLKETAVDCQLNIGQTNFSEKKLLGEIANQTIEIRLSSRGSELIPFRVGDKPRTEVCDYMADCEFKCKKPEGDAIHRGIIKNTYDENFIKNNSVVIMKKIRDLFMERMVYRRDHLISAINFIKKYPIEHIYYALTRFVQNKFEGLVDKYGRSGYLISRGEYYAFQPNEIMDETISMYERNVPVDYKPVSLRLELPKEFKPLAKPVEKNDGELQGREYRVEEEGQTNKTSEMVPVVPATRPSSSSSYEELMARLRSVVQRMIKKDLSVKATDSDWYNHANRIVPELLTVHGVKSDLINKYVIFHFLDKLPMADKLVFISKLYNGEEVKKNAYETIVRLYFDDLLMEADELGERQIGIVLADGEVNRLFVKDEENQWNLSQFTDERLFENVRKSRLIIPLEKINRTEIGFMHPFKGKEIVFKTKDVTQKRNNKGAKCTDSSKMMISDKIASIMGEPGLYKSTDIERPELCVLLEILMRWKSEATDIIYFFGPERTNEMGIVNFRI